MLRPFPVLVLSALLLTTLAPVATADTTITVALTVSTDLGEAADLDPATFDALPGTAHCDVTVPAGASAADVLDQATTDGCILFWTYTTFGDERFVTGVDGLEAVGLTCIAWPHACQWWEVRTNGVSASTGVDGIVLADGDVLKFFFHTA